MDENSKWLDLPTPDTFCGDKFQCMRRLKTMLALKHMSINCSWINLGLKFKNHFKALSRVSEELLVKATMANNVSCFKMHLMVLASMIARDCAQRLYQVCAAHVQNHG